MNINFSTTISNNRNGSGGIIIRNGGQQISISNNGISITGGIGLRINLITTGSNSSGYGSSSIRLRQNGQNILMNNRGIYIRSLRDNNNPYNYSDNDNQLSYESNDSSILEEENEDEDSIDYRQYYNNMPNMYNSPRAVYNNRSQPSLFASQGARLVYGDYFPDPYYQSTFERRRGGGGGNDHIGLKKNQINTIPTTTYKKPVSVRINTRGEKIRQKVEEEPSTNNTCAICIIDYRPGDQLRSLKCKHNFHKDCIDKWLELKNECPVCKNKAIQIINKFF